MWATAGICIPLPTIPATPITPSILNRSLPIRLPIAMLYFFLTIETSVVTNSGEEVPAAIWLFR